MKNQFDPYDVEKKREFHPKADQKNFIDERRGKLVLRCGGKKRRGGLCKSIAGYGTDHTGYGRCKHCGGKSTGPKTPEGKALVGKGNARKHGLYAKHFNEKEKAIYEDLVNKKDFSLTEELSFLRTKLTSYLEYVWIQERAMGKKGLIRYKYSRGGEVSQYVMGSVEDPHVHKTLEQIRRLVHTAKAIDETNEHSLLEEINAELRAASQKESAASWGANIAQRRVPDTE
ncbi:hypothetical protein [Bacillus infantis]|uniref:hypothetical protein n=1 Tax=Bacillus infantis TaxID=324767 RepID=UPI003CF9C6C5